MFAGFRDGFLSHDSLQRRDNLIGDCTLRRTFRETVDVNLQSARCLNVCHPHLSDSRCSSSVRKYTRRRDLPVSFSLCLYKRKAWFVTMAAAAASFPFLPVAIFVPLSGISKCDSASRETSASDIGIARCKLYGVRTRQTLCWIAVLCFIISAPCRRPTLFECQKWELDPTNFEPYNENVQVIIM